MYRFLVILLLLNSEIFALEAPTNTASNQVQNDIASDERQSFIEKGDSSLPVAPEVAKTLRSIELPNVPKPIDEPTLTNSTEKESLAPKQEPKTDTKTTPDITKQAQLHKDLPQPGSLRASPTTPPKPTQEVAPPPAPITQAKIEPSRAKYTTPAETKGQKLEPTPMMQIVERKRSLKPRPLEQKPIKPAINDKKEIIDPAQMKFVKDELLLLMFKDDDIILGKLSEDARIDQMSSVEYIKLYEKYIEKKKNRDNTKKIDWFILGHAKEAPVMLPKKYLLKNSIKDIESSNLRDLRVLADNYSILDMLDKNGNNLLHIAIFNDSALITKWLIMKGIDINRLNNNSTTALELSDYLQYWEIFNLLEKAGAK